MKKYFSLLAMAAMAACSLTSCEDDNNGVAELKPVTTSDGVFVINNGSQLGGNDGSLTYYDYGTATATQDMYRTANGVSLGATPNHAVVYGSKIYIVGSDEKTIFIADRQTLKRVTNLKVEVDGEAATPRQAVAGNGCIYVSTFSHVVVVVDTLTNVISHTLESGDYSEGMALEGKHLYVANSNYGQGVLESSRPSISMIDLETRETKLFTHEAISNPVDVKIVAGRMFFLDSGTYIYNDDWIQVGAGVYELADGNVTKIANATEMACCDGKIFTIYAPFTTPSTTPTYQVYDVEDNTLTAFCDGSDISYPCKISADPIKNYVYITSYRMASTGYPDYKAPGYCVVYGTAGTKHAEFDCGIGPGYAVPNFSVGHE